MAVQRARGCALALSLALARAPTSRATIAPNSLARTRPPRPMPMSGPVTVNGRTLVRPVIQEACEFTGVTLTRYCTEFALANPGLRDLSSILACVQTACKSIAHIVRQAPLCGYGYTVRDVAHGRCPMCSTTDDVLRNALRFTGKIGVLSSPDMPGPQEMAQDDAYKDARARKGQPLRTSPELVLRTEENFVATFTSLDSCDLGQPTGTVFGIFADNTEEACLVPDDDSMLPGAREAACIARTLRPGTALVASGCCVYSAATQMTVSLGAGTHTFTLDVASGEFVLTHADVQLSERGPLLCMDAGDAVSWDLPIANYVRRAQERGSRTVRSSGSPVVDAHRVLHGGGGLFGCPAMEENPDGRLRLLYEAAPLAFLFEQAGGAAATGLHPLMRVEPVALGQRVPVYLGSSGDVQDVVRAFEEAAARNPSLKKRCDERIAASPDV